MQEVEGSHNAVDVGELALDAFTDGKSRPRYLGRPRDTLPVHAGSVEPADADDSGAIDAAALITDEHDDGGHDDGGHDGGLYDHGADAPTSDALLATEHDDSDAPTGGVPRWDADDLEVDPVDAVEVDDDDLDTGDHLPPDRR